MAYLYNLSGLCISLGPVTNCIAQSSKKCMSNHNLHDHHNRHHIAYGSHGSESFGGNFLKSVPGKSREVLVEVPVGEDDHIRLMLKKEKQGFQERAL